MKQSRIVVSLFAAASAAAFLVSTEAPAHACGGEIWEESVAKTTPAQLVARAEKSLESGQNLAAATTVLTSFPGVRSATVGADPIETRALRVLALAVARTDGAADEKKAQTKTQNGVDWTPATNLAWAVQTLREVDQHRPNDPTVQADLGETLAHTASGQAEALKILGGLAQKDLMGSPRAYAALAKLRTQSGDAAGAELALKRCEEMSRTPGVCRPATRGAATPAVASKV